MSDKKRALVSNFEFLISNLNSVLLLFWNTFTNDYWLISIASRGHISDVCLHSCSRFWGTGPCLVIICPFRSKLNRSGHRLTHTPHLLHRWWLMESFIPIFRKGIFTFSRIVENFLQVRKIKLRILKRMVFFRKFCKYIVQSAVENRRITIWYSPQFQLQDL